MEAEARQSGLFFSELVTQQTSVEAGEKPTPKRRAATAAEKDFERRANREAYARPPAEAMEIQFRHSGWMIERLRVQHAQIAANLSGDRRERFANCGADCVVEYSPSLKKHRLRANYCGDRFCLPCARARSKKIERAMVKRLAGEQPLFITLTCRSSTKTLGQCLDHLTASFRRLRQQVLWKSAVKGGVAVIEIKKGSGSNAWHPHLHILASSKFLSAAKLSDAWKLASDGSFIVDVQRVNVDGRGVAYVCKYAGKGWTTEVVRDHQALVECMCALRGRRLLITFGTWSKLLDDPDGPVATDWNKIGRLTTVMGAFDRGEAWAHAVMRSIGFEVLEEPNPPPDLV